MVNYEYRTKGNKTQAVFAERVMEGRGELLRYGGRVKQIVDVWCRQVERRLKNARGTMVEINTNRVEKMISQQSSKREMDYYNIEAQENARYDGKLIKDIN